MAEKIGHRLLMDHDANLHAHHLCYLTELRQMRTVAQLAKDGKYICRSCGRVAAKAENLCEPAELEA